MELDLTFQFVKQIGPTYGFGNTPGARNINQPIYVLGAWQNPGDEKTIQRYNSNSNYDTQFYDALSSDAGFTDASYIRLKNLSLSYTVRANWINKMHLDNFKIYVQGQNLLTITKFKGLDPENLSTTNVPPLRVLTLGVKAGF